MSLYGLSDGLGVNRRVREQFEVLPVVCVDCSMYIPIYLLRTRYFEYGKGREDRGNRQMCII
jgi:hypothetical protein